MTGSDGGWPTVEVGPVLWVTPDGGVSWESCGGALTVDPSLEPGGWGWGVWVEVPATRWEPPDVDCVAEGVEDSLDAARRAAEVQWFELCKRDRIASEDLDRMMDEQEGWDR